jgi:hypothetical protein
LFQGTSGDCFIKIKHKFSDIIIKHKFSSSNPMETGGDCFIKIYTHRIIHKYIHMFINIKSQLPRDWTKKIYVNLINLRSQPFY